MATEKERGAEIGAELEVQRLLRAERMERVRVLALPVIALLEMQGSTIRDLEGFLSRVSGVNESEVKWTLGQMMGRNKALVWKQDNYLGYAVNPTADDDTAWKAVNADVISVADGMKSREIVLERVQGQLALEAFTEQEYRLQKGLADRTAPIGERPTLSAVQ